MHELMQLKLLLAICKLLLSIEGIQKELMKSPVKLLLYRYKYSSFVSEDISEGIFFVRIFWCRYKLCREVLRAEIWDGMDPVSLLSYKNNSCSFVSADSSDGIWPVRLF